MDVLPPNHYLFIYLFIYYAFKTSVLRRRFLMSQGGWGEGQRQRAGQDGKGIERKRLLLFLLGYSAGVSADETLACSRRSDSGERCEEKRSAKKYKSEGGGEVRAPLSPVPLYFSSLSLLRTALHYLNAWNRLMRLGREIQTLNKNTYLESFPPCER